MSVGINIFGGYDVRGVYPDQISEDFAERLGAASAEYFDTDKIIVGRDGRVSSPSLHAALIKGITRAGVSVIDLGVVSNPMTTFAMVELGVEYGALVSASHNPAEYNGIKLWRLVEKKLNGVQQLSAHDGFDDIQAIMKRGAQSRDDVSDQTIGSVKEMSILEEYLRHLQPLANQIKGLKVVADYGNGVGSVSAHQLFGSMDIGYTPLYETIDGTFPNHPADNHSEENFADLIAKVRETGADIGLFFDGDADRCIAVDEVGDIVSAEYMAGIYALDHLHARKDRSDDRDMIYHDLRFSRAVPELIQQAGGKTKKLPVGNTYYKDALLANGGYMGAEWTGHIMFAENWTRDDGLYNALLLMGIMSKTGKKLSDLAAPFRKYYKPFEINTKLSKQPEIEAVKQAFEQAFSDGEFSYIDGISVDYPDWWFNVRLSNTSPTLRLTIEGPDKEFVDEKIKQIRTIITELVGT